MPRCLRQRRADALAGRRHWPGSPGQSREGDRGDRNGQNIRSRPDVAGPATRRGPNGPRARQGVAAPPTSTRVAPAPVSPTSGVVGRGQNHGRGGDAGEGRRKARR
jgi:hypothetical protein